MAKESKMKKIITTLLLLLIFTLVMCQIYDEPTAAWLDGCWSFNQNDFSFYYYFGRDSSFKKVNNSGTIEECGTFRSNWLYPSDKRYYCIKFYNNSGQLIKTFTVSYSGGVYTPNATDSSKKMIVQRDGYGRQPQTLWKQSVSQRTPSRKKDNVDKIIDKIFGG